MKTSTRLILLLTVMVGIVMLAGGIVFLRLRKVVLETALHNEVRAHALTLQIALEDHYRAGRTHEAQQLIDNLSKNPRVYGVVLFDEEGRITMASNPLTVNEIRFPPEVKSVLATNKTIETIRRIRQREVFSIIVPIQVNETRHAFEIAQPMAFIEADLVRARRDISVITLVLFLTITCVVILVTRHSLVHPINELLRGASALGHGNLDYRVPVVGNRGELAQLATEFNRMADGLQEQRTHAEAEAAQRLALERELRHSERLASVGRLAAGVAHEIGTPLNVIGMRTEQLLEQTGGASERRARNVEIIRGQVERITQFVRQLLNLARPSHHQRERVDLAELLGATWELLEAQATFAAITGELNLAPGLLVSGDRGTLQQVFTNIIQNAIMAMSAGGQLRIEGCAAPLTTEGTSWIMLQISDTGGGIAPEHLPFIFEPFYTTKDVGSGNGLGLSISHRFVEEHGGTLEAANNRVGGATFTIRLPMIAAAPCAVAEEVVVR